MPAMTKPNDSTVSTAHDHDALRAARRKKLERIITLGLDPYGQRFDGRTLIGEIRARAAEIMFRSADGQSIELPDLAAQPPGFDFRQWLAEQGPGELVGPTVRAAGRVVLARDTGKLVFLDIEDWTGKVQVFLGKNQVGEENWQLVECLDLGDIVGVDGTLRRTKTGELTVFATHLHMLCKSLEPPPDKHKGLADPELRQRQRYVDLAYNPDTLERFLHRSRIVASMRKTLAEHGFVEIEGPTLHSIAGGAAARPFTTHHNALDMDLFLRIALELHLKRAMVGGMERVFELGRVFRNEGISPRHNPEFTMLEVYQAYGDYRSMMDLTEALIVGALRAIGGDRQVKWQGATIDLTPPFTRRTYDDLLAEFTDVDPLDSDQVQATARAAGLEVAGRHPDVIKNELFELRVPDRLTGPVFVTDYPASICPLTKRRRDNAAVAERFELVIGGLEMANAYTELNDPDLQQRLFETQLEGLAADESMARMDHDFLRALRYGMPPAGGLGIGVDRLVMLLTGCDSIRDVILFPLLRPAGEG